MLLTPHYKHTQFGKVVVVSLALTALLLVGVGIALGDWVLINPTNLPENYGLRLIKSQTKRHYDHVSGHLACLR